MYKLVFYVPSSHLEIVKTAVFQAGAGRYGAYDCCAWQVKGQGQFRPLDGATPFIGTQDQLEQIEEYRVELLCDDDAIEQVLQALKKAHPYESPGYEAWKMEYCGAS